MNLPPQASFFYYGVWTPESDTIILDTIIALKKETQWTDTEFPNWFSMTIAHELESKVSVKVSEVDVAKRVEFLHKRYRIFKDVVVVFRAQWDQTNKVVVAGDDLWEQILKQHWFAAAYFHNDEPEYTKLACVFGMSDVKVEGPKQVIVISETNEIVSTEELPNYEAGELNEEVNSPAIFPPKSVRRELFPVEEVPTDRESTTDLGIYFIDLAPDGQLRTRFEKGRSLPPPPRRNRGETDGKPTKAGPSIISQNASSCGSNSPIGWWPHLAK